MLPLYNQDLLPSIQHDQVTAVPDYAASSASESLETKTKSVKIQVINPKL